jgi:FAD/FMN-containing dehydrogenase
MNLEEIVPEESLLTEPEVLEGYRRDQSFVCPIRPRSVVKARSAGEVQALVKWANQTGTPLVPVSSAGPHFHGDTVPSVGGAVILDLSAMKRVIRVDRRNRMAVIEPGVTFDELRSALAKEGLAPLMPLAPRRGKSVLASFLERTPITTPRFHWEPQDPAVCRVIYGTGDLMRTGSARFRSRWRPMGARQGAAAGMGPSQVDFTRLLQGAQGTLGIVTWGSIKCRPWPKQKKMFLVGCAEAAPLVEMAYRILFRKLGEELLVLNRTSLAALLGGTRRDPRSESDCPLDPGPGDRGAGVLPEEKIAYQEAECAEVAQSLGLELHAVLPGATARSVGALLSRPSPEPYWKLRLRGACAEIFFLTTLAKASGFIDTVRGLTADRLYPAEEVGVYIQPTVQGANCHVQFDLSYDPASRREAEKVAWLVDEGAEILAREGAFFSRPYGPWARVAYACDPQLAIAQRKLKGIFDPNGILNPGKLCF